MDALPIKNIGSLKCHVGCRFLINRYRAWLEHRKDSSRGHRKKHDREESRPIKPFYKTTSSVKIVGFGVVGGEPGSVEILSNYTNSADSEFHNVPANRLRPVAKLASPLVGLDILSFPSL